MEITNINDFSQLVNMITISRENALRKVNEELINLYWNIGEYIFEELKNSNKGDAYITEMSKYIQDNCPGIKGFSSRGLYRMKKFYETYKGNSFSWAVLTQISWSNHTIILSASKSDEEREFYMKLCIKERYSARELQRQIDSGYYERYMLSKLRLEPVPLPNRVKNEFLDRYVLDFLDLPDKFSENQLQKGITDNIKNFLLEFGKDFTFMGQEYRVQVGGHDYYIDLLFYHRGLACLVAFELKIGEFKPEYIGKMNFYLEALDRENKKENENPSVGIILCATKDDEVIEFALSRSLSPTLVAEYTTKLIDKNLLKEKLHELTQLVSDEKELGDGK